MPQKYLSLGNSFSESIELPNQHSCKLLYYIHIISKVYGNDTLSL